MGHVLVAWVVGAVSIVGAAGAITILCVWGRALMEIFVFAVIFLALPVGLTWGIYAIGSWVLEWKP